MEILVLYMSTIDPFSPLSDSSSGRGIWHDQEDDIVLILTMWVNKRPKYGGYVFDREFLRRDRQEAHNQLMHNYFCLNPVYLERYFRRWFRMYMELCLRILPNAWRDMAVPSSIEKMCHAADLGDAVPYFKAAVGDAKKLMPKNSIFAGLNFTSSTFMCPKTELWLVMLRAPHDICMLWIYSWWVEEGNPFLRKNNPQSIPVK